MTNVIKVRFMRDGQAYGREYTYRTPCWIKVSVNDVVDIEQRGSTVHGLVTQVDVPEQEIAAFGDRAKSILGLATVAEAADKLTLSDSVDREDLTATADILPGPADLSTDIIVVRQLPVIEEQLMMIRDGIRTKVDYALSMVCTEDTVKEIKVLRSALNKDFTALEGKRKEVKKAILSPYEQFEAIYKSCVTDIFRPADVKLKEKIDEVEAELKDEKAAEVIAYFYEYLLSKDIDFVSFEQTGITVTLTASKKALKEQCTAFVDKVVEELALIDTQEHKAEILVEYKKTLNVAQAITAVSNRIKAIAAERERQAQLDQREAEKLATVQAVDAVIGEPVSAPSVTEADGDGPGPDPDEALSAHKLFTVTFAVTGTIDELRALKIFLANNGIKFEAVK